MRRAVAVVAVVIGCSCALQAQSVRSLLHGGNDLYRLEKFSDAEVRYRKALEKEQGLVQGHFNLGDALHKQGKYDEAIREYDAALQGAERKETRAFAHYNKGNSHLRQEKYQDAVASYIDALKLNPLDSDAKYNLSYALEKMRQQQQQNKNQQQRQNDNQDKKQNQQRQQQDQNQQKKTSQQQQSQAARQQQERSMSKPEAQRILDVLKNSERDVQKKLRARAAVRAKTDKDW